MSAAGRPQRDRGIHSSKERTLCPDFHGWGNWYLLYVSITEFILRKPDFHVGARCEFGESHMLSSMWGLFYTVSFHTQNNLVRLGLFFRLGNYTLRRFKYLEWGHTAKKCGVRILNQYVFETFSVYHVPSKPVFRWNLRCIYCDWTTVIQGKSWTL